jgi:hypothetical protein
MGYWINREDAHTLAAPIKELKLPNEDAMQE